MCSCDAEFMPQPVAETNQMTSDNADDTKLEMVNSLADEDTAGNTNNPIGCELCLLLAHHWRICW